MHQRAGPKLLGRQQLKIVGKLERRQLLLDISVENLDLHFKKLKSENKILKIKKNKN